MKNDMKTTKVFSKFILLLGLIITITACGSDDHRQEYTLKDAVFEYTYNLGIANAGGLISTKEENIPLDQLLSEYTYNTPIRSGSLNLTSETSILISAENEDIELRDFILTVNDIDMKLGNLTVANTELYTSDNLQTVIRIFNKMISENKLRIKTRFTPSRKITDEDHLNIKFIIKADYTYRQ